VTAQPGEQKRRSDARRSIAAILDAAITVLSERPQASIDEVARVAGVSRQTVYAHFPSRGTLIRAVHERALGEAVAAIETARLHQGSAAAALDRLVAAGWQTLERYPLVLDLRVEMTPEEELALHQPILERLERLIRRGQRRGEFDRTLPANWLLTAFLALTHAAGEEVRAGRLTANNALEVLRRSVLRVFGVSTDAIENGGASVPSGGSIRTSSRRR
jgi:AcrR family transcriptional regulator